MECLKIEIDLIDRNMARSETITQGVKNFAIVSWAALTTAILGQVELRKYILIIAIIPIMFWFVDAWWIFLYRENSLRFRKISEFINSNDFLVSYKQNKLYNFMVFDRDFGRHKNTLEYQKFVNFRKVFLFREMIILYGGLILFSVIIGIIALRIF